MGRACGSGCSRRGLCHSAELTAKYYAPILLTMYKSGLSTLQNPLLFAKLKKKIENVNPDFDLEHIDRNLEYEEAVNDLQSKHGLSLSPQRAPMAEFRSYLSDRGISAPRLQNLIMSADAPASEASLDNLAYVLSARPRHAWNVDRGKKAKKITRDPFLWASAPNRMDIRGIDTPGSNWPFW